MTSYKLTYFDFDGGRGEPIRIALHAAGIDFEDIRWSFPEFGEKRHGTRFNAVPVMEIDGAAVTQSNGLSRYIGKLAGLYPADDLQAFAMVFVTAMAEIEAEHVGARLEQGADHGLVRGAGPEGRNDLGFTVASHGPSLASFSVTTRLKARDSIGLAGPRQ